MTISLFVRVRVLYIPYHTYTRQLYSLYMCSITHTRQLHSLCTCIYKIISLFVQARLSWPALVRANVYMHITHTNLYHVFHLYCENKIEIATCFYVTITYAIFISHILILPINLFAFGILVHCTISFIHNTLQIIPV